MEKPYVISAELELGNETIIIPKQIDNWREDLDTELRAMGKNTTWITTTSLQNGLNRRIDATRLPTISLDDRYISLADNYLGISRGVNRALDDIGYQSRGGYPPITAQLDSIPRLGAEIIVADDVVFSGEMISWLSDELATRSVKIGGVICGVAMREGIEKLAKRGIPVETVEIFDDAEDEICERDFAVLPGSGRRVGEMSAYALYFDPANGKPEQWASIPRESIDSFCYSSLKRSLKLQRPELPSHRVGRFIGYERGATIQQQIINRMKELS